MSPKRPWRALDGPKSDRPPTPSLFRDNTPPTFLKRPCRRLQNESQLDPPSTPSPLSLLPPLPAVPVPVPPPSLASSSSASPPSLAPPRTLNHVTAYHKSPPCASTLHFVSNVSSRSGKAGSYEHPTPPAETHVRANDSTKFHGSGWDGDGEGPSPGDNEESSPAPEKTWNAIDTTHHPLSHQTPSLPSQLCIFVSVSDSNPNPDIPNLKPKHLSS